MLHKKTVILLLLCSLGLTSCELIGQVKMKKSIAPPTNSELAKRNGEVLQEMIRVVSMKEPESGELFGYYTRRFNARYGRTGPLFRTKFLRRVMIGPLAITDAIRRVHAFPKNDGLVTEPGDEPWSSHACYEHGGRSDGVITLYAPTVVTVRRMPPSRTLDS